MNNEEEGREGKERDRGIEGETPPTPSRGADVLIGDEEQNGKQKRTKKKDRVLETRMGSYTITEINKKQRMME